LETILLDDASVWLLSEPEPPCVRPMVVALTSFQVPQMPIAFNKTRSPFGWLGNMSRHAIRHAGRVWPTAEHLFQALRFEDEAVREAVRAEPNPFRAKLLAKAESVRMAVSPCSENDVSNMQLVLRLKMEQHPELQERLLQTGHEEIIEDCTGRVRGNALFWGAARKDGSWAGENRLGRLWMKLREELVAASRAEVASSPSG
jgi:ribA/ribD-fused uncharacterized protein